MSSIIRQDVIEMAPELSGVSDVAWAVILAYVNEITGEGLGVTATSPKLKLARILLAAHYVTISKRGRSGAAGPVTSVAAGAVRRSYGLVALASSDASLGSTGYGQQFLGVVSMSAANGPRLV